MTASGLAAASPKRCVGACGYSAAPLFDDDFGLLECVEDFAVEQLRTSKYLAILSAV